MRKFNKMFDHYKLVVLPFPTALRMYVLKHNKQEFFTDSDINDSFMYLVYDMFVLSKKLVYDINNGITPEDLYHLVVSNGFDSVGVVELNDLLSAIEHGCREMLAWLVTYDLYYSNIYIHELSEDKIVLEVEEHLA